MTTNEFKTKKKTKSYQKSLADESATIELGKQLAKYIALGSVIYLEGDLGAGKTTLVRGFLRAFGYLGAVKSPTFTVVEPYQLDNNKFYDYNQLEDTVKADNKISSINIYHFDLYRLVDPEELEYLGIRDYFDAHSIALIEWPDKGLGVLPLADLVLTITHQHKGRIVALKPLTHLGEQIVSKLI